MRTLIALLVTMALCAGPKVLAAPSEPGAGLYRVGAERHFEALRAVTDFRIGWDAYVRAREEVAETPWYRTIREIFPFFVYGDYGEALESWLVESDPEIYFRRLSRVPTLGIYFEHDQSNPPDSSRRFRRAVESAGNVQVDVEIFPGVNHGAWVVSGLAFEPAEIRRREPAVFDAIAAWVNRQAR